MAKKKLLSTEESFSLLTNGDQTALNKEVLIYYAITAIDTRYLRVLLFVCVLRITNPAMTESAHHAHL
jgi:hypothetical protein